MHFNQRVSLAAHRFFEARSERIAAYAGKAWGVGRCHFCGRASMYAYCPWGCIGGDDNGISHVG